MGVPSSARGYRHSLYDAQHGSMLRRGSEGSRHRERVLHDSAFAVRHSLETGGIPSVAGNASDGDVFPRGAR